MEKASCKTCGKTISAWSDETIADAKANSDSHGDQGHRVEAQGGWTHPGIKDDHVPVPHDGRTREWELARSAKKHANFNHETDRPWKITSSTISQLSATQQGRFKGKNG